MCMYVSHKHTQMHMYVIYKVLCKYKDEEGIMYCICMYILLDPTTCPVAPPRGFLTPNTHRGTSVAQDLVCCWGFKSRQHMRS